MSKTIIQPCIAIALIILLISGCTCNSYYNDRPEDVSEAEQTTENFYALLSFGRHDQIYSLMSNRFLESADMDTLKLAALLKEFDVKLGKVDSFHLEKWQTRVVTGTNPVANYSLIYSVKRGENKGRETFNLEKENGKVKISGYHVESEGFLK